MLKLTLQAGKQGILHGLKGKRKKDFEHACVMLLVLNPGPFIDKKPMYIRRFIGRMCERQPTDMQMRNILKKVKSKRAGVNEVQHVEQEIA